MLKKLVQIVVKNREMTAAAKARRDQLQDQMYASPLGQRYLESVDVYKMATQWLKDAESALRQAAVSAFDGVNKKLYAGLGIRVSKPKPVLQINADPRAVRSWAINNAPSALMVDEALLLTLTEKGLVPPHIAEVVMTTPVVSATIPTKLEAE